MTYNKMTYKYNKEAELLYYRRKVLDQYTDMVASDLPLPDKAIRNIVTSGPFGSSSEQDEEIIRELEVNFADRNKPID